MTGMTQPPEVTDNPAESRFEIRIGGELAELTYRRRADRLILVHTGVPGDLAGHGLAGVLTRAAVAKAAAEGLTIVPLCPFARSFLERHPDAADGVPIDWGAGS
jgi:predicted GNAT family acetyltransferase